jgi:hypothetical protein
LYIYLFIPVNYLQISKNRDREGCLRLHFVALSLFFRQIKEDRENKNIMLYSQLKNQEVKNDKNNTRGDGEIDGIKY